MKRYIPQVVGCLCASSLVLAAAGQIRADITDGFSSANASNWTFNANATSTSNSVPLISGSVLVLTSDNGNEASSAWYNTPQDISSSWTATFTWQWTSAANNPADGFMFVLQNAGLNALGGAGGSKGYQGGANSTSNIAVTPSVGVGVENYGGDTNNLTLGINDQFAQSINVPGSTLNAHTDANPINFTVSYYAPDNVVNVSAVDSTISSNAFSYNIYSMPGQYSMDTYPLNPATVVGQNTAYVGFTGATGGASEEQDFSNFNFSAGASVPPNYQAPPSTPAYVSVTRSPIALTASSFNEAEVVPNTASLTEGATSPIPTSVLAGSVDGSYAFYEAGTSVTENGTATPLPGGLPTSGQFVSQGDGVTTFQFQPYTGNTALAISSNPGQMGQNGKPLPISGTMTLASPHAFSTLAILATSGNGASFANVRFNFVDSHGDPVDVATDYAAFDWYNGGSGTTPDGNAWGTCLAGIGRIKISNSTPDAGSVSSGNPKLYETAFNLANLTGLNDAGQLVTGNYSGDILNSLTFFGPSGNVTNIYAVSGSADAASSVPEPSVALLLFAGAGLSLVLRQRATGAQRR
jgi:hypothetical protein